jgi:hypothetical protein
MIMWIIKCVYPDRVPSTCQFCVHRGGGARDLLFSEILDLGQRMIAA